MPDERAKAKKEQEERAKAAMPPQAAVKDDSDQKPAAKPGLKKPPPGSVPSAASAVASGDASPFDMSSPFSCGSNAMAQFQQDCMETLGSRVPKTAQIKSIREQNTNLASSRRRSSSWRGTEPKAIHSHLMRFRRY